MNEPGRLGHTPTDPVAGSRAFGPSFGYLVIALLVLAGGIAYWVASPEEPARAAYSSPTPAAMPDAAPAAGSAPAEPAATSESASAMKQPEANTQEQPGDLTPDLRAYLNPGENPTMTEVLDRLHRAGVYTGIGAFSPPGTKPTLIGLAVPEDFALPDGYVRHHQTTDDGQPIEPILMYAPDRQVFDTAGQPIAVPQNRVVPPELAPPGLPHRRIAIPAPIEADRPGS
jgi:hypothetical protein